jgi:hypothetical protein
MMIDAPVLGENKTQNISHPAFFCHKQAGVARGVIPFLLVSRLVLSVWGLAALKLLE